MNAHFSIKLLGTMHVAMAARAITSFPTDSVRALLALLAQAYPSTVSRQRLASMLWPEHEQEAAMRNLRQALSRLRRCVAGSENPARVFLSDHSTVGLNPALRPAADVQIFTELLQRVRVHKHRHVETCPACIQDLEKAADVYRGDFLTDLTLKRNEVFEEWVRSIRQQYLTQIVAALSTLASHYQRRARHDRVLFFARRLLELEPWHEGGHRHVMWGLWADGKIAEAVHQYQTCELVLSKELGIKPGTETINLYRCIQRREPPEQPTRPAAALPAQSTPFIGRFAELREIERLMSDREARLVTLAGMSGMGKTRLALRAAELASYAFEHGAVFVPLISVRSQDEVIHRLAETLGLTFDGPAGHKEQVLSFLARREMLVVLDNFEHLLNESELVSQILRRAPSVKVIVTSIEPLNMLAECVVEVAGLSVTQAGDSDAVQLFLDRARRKRPSFEASVDDIVAIVHICETVQGMPLAIELAAGMVATSPSSVIAATLERSLKSLVSNASDLPRRHRSVVAILDNTWHSLSKAKREKLHCLSIFPGDFTGEAAAAVTTLAQETLGEFTTKNLLRLQANSRYSFHPLIRKYAVQQRGVRPESPVLIRRFVSYFSTFVAQRAERLHGEEAFKVLAELDSEAGNIRTAWFYALEKKDSQSIDAMLNGLANYYEIRSRFAQGQADFEEALSAFDAASPLVTRLRARLGIFLVRLGRLDKGERIINECLAVFRQIEDLKSTAMCLYCLGTMKLQGAPLQALSALEECLELEKKLARPLETARTLLALGNVRTEQRKGDAARILLEEGLAICRTLGAQVAVGEALLNLGQLAHFEGKYEEANARLFEGITILQQSGHRYGVARAQTLLASVSFVLGDYASSESHIRACIEFWREVGATHQEAIALSILALALLSRNEVAEAQNTAMAALGAASPLGEPFALSFARYSVAEGKLSGGDPAGAESLLREVLHSTDAMAPSAPGEILGLHAAVALAECQLAKDPTDCHKPSLFLDYFDSRIANPVLPALKLRVQRLKDRIADLPESRRQAAST